MPIPMAATNPESFAQLLAMFNAVGGQQQGQGGQNPTTSGLSQGGTAGLDGLFKFLMETDARKMGKQQMGRQKYLFNKTAYANPKENVIDPAMISNMVNQYRMSLKPQFSQMGANAARMGSLSSPDIQFGLGQDMAYPIMGRIGELQNMNLNMMQTRNIQNLLAALRTAGA